MNNINCFGKEKKQVLVKKFYLKPVLYIGLLPGQEKEGCCGKLTNRYYIFKASDKKSKEQFAFYAGKHCAEELLKLINIKPLSFFNPLRVFGETQGRSSLNNQDAVNYSKDSIHPLNKELINAISIISIAWDNPPPVSVLNIVDYTKRLDHETINEKGVLWVNRNLINDTENRTLTQIIDELRDSIPDLRNINVNNLKDYVDKNFPDEVNRY